MLTKRRADSRYATLWLILKTHATSFSLWDVARLLMALAVIAAGHIVHALRLKHEWRWDEILQNIGRS